jgi:hypothetical protein
MRSTECATASKRGRRVRRTATMRLADEMASGILKGIYKRSQNWLLRRHHLVRAASEPYLRSFEHVEAGIACALNAGFSSACVPGALVVGGACLGYADAEVNKLGLEVAADLVAPLAFAKWCNSSCLVYLTVIEEARMSVGTISIDRWKNLADAVERFIFALAKTMGVERICVMRTDVPAVDRILDASVEKRMADLRSEAVNDLYAIDSSGRTVRRPLVRLDQYRRYVISYCPSVLQASMHMPIDRIVVAENIHQVRAINKARELSIVLGMSTEDCSNRIDHIAYLSPPSITGSRRMARAGERSAIFLSESADVTRSKVAKMADRPRYYWRHIWPRPLAVQITDDAVPTVEGLVLGVQSLFRRALVS